MSLQRTYSEFKDFLLEANIKFPLHIIGESAYYPEVLPEVELKEIGDTALEKEMSLNITLNYFSDPNFTSGTTISRPIFDIVPHRIRLEEYKNGEFKSRYKRGLNSDGKFIRIVSDGKFIRIV